MGRKGALFTLVLVVLWAAAPAFACMAPAPCHPCCKAMVMDCEPAMAAAHPCCQLQSSQEGVPPGQAAATTVSAGVSQTIVSATLPQLSAGTLQAPSPSEAPPPRSLSGASSILRI